MEIQTQTYGDKVYTVANDTFYNKDTDYNMVKILESIRERGTRVRFHWGDTKTGLDWGDVYDVAGTLSRSMGPVKIPILINNIRSFGGGGILDSCIVKITYSNKKQGGTIYQHPGYHTK